MEIRRNCFSCESSQTLEPITWICYIIHKYPDIWIKTRQSMGKSTSSFFSARNISNSDYQDLDTEDLLVLLSVPPIMMTMMMNVWIWCVAGAGAYGVRGGSCADHPINYEWPERSTLVCLYYIDSSVSFTICSDILLGWEGGIRNFVHCVHDCHWICSFVTWTMFSHSHISQEF